ncbi:hypothetical protein Q1695_007200 [Nippostrongylus brasiliensis]|nr:hypothetical protein Q1695_007200 [Nippostrongylus brasiliensis]
MVLTITVNQERVRQCSQFCGDTALFRNKVRRDGTDMPGHSPGKLTTRLTTDPSNVWQWRLLENIRTVQTPTMEPTKLKKRFHYLTKPLQTSKRKAVIHRIAVGVACSTTFFLYAISYRFGVWLITNSYLSPMNVLRSLFAISFTAGSLGYASAYFPEYIKATSAAGLIFSMPDEEPQIDGMTDKGEKSQISGAIAFEGVYFKYPQRPKIPILRELNVSFGQTLALVGSCRCRKSNVISLLEGLHDLLDEVVVRLSRLFC